MLRKRNNLIMKQAYKYLPAFILFMICLCISANALAAGTVAGTLIQNQATATYIDVNNNPYTAQSNVATIKVAQVYSADLGVDRTKFASAGQTVYFTHSLQNTGNGPDTYAVKLTQAITGGDTKDYSNLKIYLDMNNNGQADAGETLIASVGSPGSIIVQPDDKINMVIEATIPGVAIGNDTLGVTLEVNATQGIVNDTTSAKGLDLKNGTNEDKATVTTNAVLNVTKTATYNDQGTKNDISDDTITYTVVISNTGTSPANLVNIYDPLDLTKIDVNNVSQIIMGTVSGDYGSQAPQPTNDANGDGTPGDYGVKGIDDTLPGNTTVSYTYTVPLKDTLKSSDIIESSVTIKGDTNANGNNTDLGETVTSNKTLSGVPSVYGVTAKDTGTGLSAGINDGGDDDGALNDTQLVDNAPSGETVIFTNVITNTGNDTDYFQLSLPNPGDVGNTFPIGTVFTLWNAGGTTALLDNDGNGVVDTGPMASDANKTIVIKAKLPAGAYDGDGTHNGPYSATLTAVSAGNGAIKDTAIEKLSSIAKPKVDLSSSTGKTINGADNNSALNKNPYTAGSITPVVTNIAGPGADSPFWLTVQNDSGVSDSFQLSAGGSYSGADYTLGSLPPCWNLVFHDVNDNVITTTPALAPGASYVYHVHINICSDPPKALANYQSDFNSDGIIEVVDGNGDGDGDYPIFIKVKSVNTSAYDILFNAIDVTDVENITLLSNQSGQIQAGGSITYNHNLRNDGNTVEILKLSALNSLAANGWNNSILVDITGDTIPDKPFSALTTTDKVYYYDSNGTYTFQNFGGSGFPNSSTSIALRPGERLEFKAQVYSPSSAPAGTVDTLTVTAAYNNETSKTENVDQTTVQSGQLRLIKTVAVDANCDGVPDGAFLTTTTDQVAPTKCVVWQLVIKNEGTTTASKIKISDTVPSYSDYITGSMASGLGDAGLNPAPAITLYSNTDADDVETQVNGYYAKIIGSEITFYVGSGASKTEGGSLASGAAVSMRFRTQVK